MLLTRSSCIVLACAAAVFIASCGGSSGPTNTNTTAIAKTSTASGDGQTAQVGTTLPLPLRVLVTYNGTPQSGQTVTWAAVGTGASVNPMQATTDVNGVATTNWTLGSTVGAQSATATLSGASGSPVTFTATATAAPVAVIQKAATASGDAQTDSVAATLPNPLRVLVTLSGAAQAGATVTWAATAGGGSVLPLTAVTDATGIATTSWTLGHTAGAQAATATLAGATGSPVSFSATATAGTATQLSLSAGNNQNGPTGGALANPLAVMVGDQFGNGVANTKVTWAVTSGSATLGADSSFSDAAGIATTTVMLGSTAGSVGVSATSTGLSGSPVAFGATAVAPPSAVTVTVGPGVLFTSVSNGTSNPAVDTVAVNGTVTWSWASGSLSHGIGSTGTPSFTSQTSAQTSGTYQVTFTTAGTYTYDCIVHGTAMNGRIVVR